MTVSDEDRRDLFEGFAALLDRKRANTLMELLPPVGWSDVARRGDIAELRGEMSELRGEMALLRAEFKGEITKVQSQLPKLIAANIASMIGVAGVVLAGGALL
jgi:hypothetical protein